MPNPVTHVTDFLTKPFYAEPFALHIVYWLLAISSIVIAVIAARSVPGPANGAGFGVHLWRFLVRFTIGSFWWQQSLWKFPTDTGGLRFWTMSEVTHSAFAIQGQLVQRVVLPAFTPFAFALYGFEVVVAILLLIGLYTRVVSALAALLILSLFLGLYNAPGEWPWSYAFLLVIMVTMAVEGYGASFGLDSLLRHRSPAAKRRRAAESAY